MKKYPRTFFVLDASAGFRSTVCGCDFQLDVRSRTRPDVAPLAPVSKTLYTCAIEAILEYCRIVWDIFPVGPYLNLLGATDSGTLLPNTETFLASHHNPAKYSEIVKIISEIIEVVKGKKEKKSSKSNYAYLEQAFQEVLNRMTHQSAATDASQNSGAPYRIIIFSNIADENQIDTLSKSFKKILNNTNKELSKSSKVIENLDVLLLNTFPITQELLFKFQEKKRNFNSDDFQFIHYPVKSGTNVVSKVIALLLEHFDLASTTVMNIPMKEELNSGQSTHYHVEIVHERAAHTQFVNGDFDLSEHMGDKQRDDQCYETLQLVWGLPRGQVPLNASSAFRVSPLDLHMRPTICFTNFFNSGKVVLLENNSPDRLRSHFLQIHNSEIFIHVLNNVKAPIFAQCSPASPQVAAQNLEQQSLITDYRNDDFCNFIQQNQLMPVERADSSISPGYHQQILSRKSSYWPLLTRFSLFHSVPDKMKSFLLIWEKSELTEQELTELKNSIFLQLTNDASNLPVLTNLLDGGKLKRQEYSNIFWREFELILRNHGSLSQRHQTFLENFIKLKKDILGSNNDTSPPTDEMEVNENIQVNSSDKTGTKRRISSIKDLKQRKTNLLDMFYTDFVSKQTSRVDFAGRIKYGNSARLYEDTKKDRVPQE